MLTSVASPSKIVSASSIGVPRRHFLAMRG
jgi:hypothetical protein